MCGIFGVLASNRAVSGPKLSSLLDILRHRGPDDRGAWQEDSLPLVLGHTRLSIVDVSPAGHQPMISRSGRFVLTFNGEIYNHRVLRAEIDRAGHSVEYASSAAVSSGAPARRWRGDSDTETLLAAIELWGLAATLERCSGMFAFGLWDRAEHTLHLARDRMGEKPLYYGFVGGAFAFASELKLFRALPGFVGEIDRGALALFMRHSAVPAPYCIYRGLSKLPPGTTLSVTVGQVSAGEITAPTVYWSALERASAGNLRPLAFETDEEAITALERQLSNAVAEQMVADVPLGAFLSGGIDSSTIVALMQAEARAGGSSAVKTFSIGFAEQDYDEAHHAKTIAAHLGTDHTETIMTAADAMAVIPMLATIYDEPFADSSQIPTYLVASVARKRVTVALSGDGGDEVFGGYNRHLLSTRAWPRASKIPRAIRRGLAGSIRTLSPSAWDRVLRAAAPVLPFKDQLARPGAKLHRVADILGSANGAELYSGLVSHWLTDRLVLGAEERETHLTRALPALGSLAEQMMALDAVTYLSDDILVKLDRAAMSVSLETRVPFLDRRVFEFAWRLPLKYKVRDGVGKWILRQVLYRHVPRALVDRPKMGFGIPIEAWLRGPLRDWAEHLLDETRLTQQGFLDPRPIRQKWTEHLSGRGDWHNSLWDVLMFQGWLDGVQPSSSAEVIE